MLVIFAKPAREGHHRWRSKTFSQFDASFLVWADSIGEYGGIAIFQPPKPHSPKIDIDVISFLKAIPDAWM